MGPGLDGARDHRTRRRLRRGRRRPRAVRRPLPGLAGGRAPVRALRARPGGRRGLRGGARGAVPPAARLRRRGPRRLAARHPHGAGARRAPDVVHVDRRPRPPRGGVRHRRAVRQQLRHLRHPRAPAPRARHLGPALCAGHAHPGRKHQPVLRRGAGARPRLLPPQPPARAAARTGQGAHPLPRCHHAVVRLAVRVAPRDGRARARDGLAPPPHRGRGARRPVRGGPQKD